MISGLKKKEWHVDERVRITSVTANYDVQYDIADLCLFDDTTKGMQTSSIYLASPEKQRQFIRRPLRHAV